MVLALAQARRSLVFLYMSKELSLRHGYFYATSPVYGFMATFVILFPRQGMGTGDSSAACQPVEGCYRIGRQMDAAAASASARLAYYLVAGSTVIGALSPGIVFTFRPPNRRAGAFRLKSRAGVDYGRVDPRSFPWSLTGVPQQRTGEARRFRAASFRSCASIRIFADLEPEAFDQLCRYAKHSTLKRGATIVLQGRSRQQPDRGDQRHGEDQRLLRRRPQRDPESDRPRRNFRRDRAARRAAAVGRRHRQYQLRDSSSSTGANSCPLCEASRRWR